MTSDSKYMEILCSRSYMPLWRISFRGEETFSSDAASICNPQQKNWRTASETREPREVREARDSLRGSPLASSSDYNQSTVTLYAHDTRYMRQVYVRLSIVKWNFRFISKIIFPTLKLRWVRAAAVVVF